MGLFAAIAIGSKIIGGIIGRKSAKKALRKAETQQAEANRLNEERFQRILADFRERERTTGLAFDQLRGLGEGEISNRALEARSVSKQSLVSRGLANTGRLNTEREGIDSREVEAIERLRANLLFRRTDTLGEFQRQRLAFQEGKSVTGPTAQQIGLLQQQKAQATQQIFGAAGDFGTALGGLFGRGGGGGSSLPIGTGKARPGDIGFRPIFGP